MRMNNAFPQKGIVTGIADQTANVYIPLADSETGYIESTIPLDDSMVGFEVVVIYINGDRNQGVIVGAIDARNRIRRGSITSISGSTIQVAFDANSESVQTALVLTSESIGRTAMVVYDSEGNGVLIGVIQ